MSEAVLIALLGFIASIASAFINGYYTVKAARVKQAETVRQPAKPQGKPAPSNGRVLIPVNKPGERKVKQGFLALLKSLALNMLFGFGLFTLEPQSKRKWVYPIAVLSGFISYTIAGLAPYQYHGYGWDENSVAFSLGAWGISFLDILFSWGMKRVYKI